MKQIAIDLDDTLIDTQTIKENVFQVLQKDGLPRSVVFSTYEALSLSAAYTPQSHVEHLRSRGYIKNADQIVSALQEVFHPEKRFNLAGAEDFLRQLQGQGYHLLLLTYGNSGFQMQKLRQSKLISYFEQIIVARHRDKIAALRRLKPSNGNNLIVIDDSQAVVKAAREMNILAFNVARSSGQPPDYKNILFQLNQCTGFSLSA